MKRLPDSELELMLIIWEAGEAVSRAYIQEHLKTTKELATTTILSFLSRLEAKGFLSVAKVGKVNYYYPLVKREDYVRNESKTMLEKFFGNSLLKFVVQLSDLKTEDKEQIQELKRYLESIPLEETKK